MRLAISQPTRCYIVCHYFRSFSPGGFLLCTRLFARLRQRTFGGFVNLSVAFAFATAGCYATTPNTQFNSSLSPNQIVMKNESRDDHVRSPSEGVGQWLSLDDVDPAIADRIREQLSDPLIQKQAAVAAAREAADGPVRYALAQSPLPRGAIAAVVRDREAPIKRLIIFHRGSVNDLAFSLARHALIEDAEASPNAQTRRVLLVWSDQRVESPESVKHMRYVIPATSRGDDVAILAAPRIGTVDVPGIGVVDIVGSAQ
jgi:hypothetical protein